MASNLTPVLADPALAPVLAPDGGDPRNALSVRSPLQTILGGLLWVRGILRGTVNQGVVLLSYLAADGNITSGTQLAAPLVVATTAGQFARARTGAVWTAGIGNAGVHVVDPTVTPSIFYGFFSVTAPGCILRISNAGSPMPGETLRVCTLDGGNPVTIQDPSGTLIIVIQKLDKAIHSVEISYLGGAWVLTAATYASV